MKTNEKLFNLINKIADKRTIEAFGINKNMPKSVLSMWLETVKRKGVEVL